MSFIEFKIIGCYLLRPNSIIVRKRKWNWKKISNNWIKITWLKKEWNDWIKEWVSLKRNVLINYSAQRTIKIFYSKLNKCWRPY